MNSNVDPPVITSIQYTESLIVLFVVLRVDQFKLHVCSMSLLHILLCYSESVESGHNTTVFKAC